jgi:hypothetical protein
MAVGMVTGMAAVTDMAIMLVRKHDIGARHLCTMAEAMGMHMVVSTGAVVTTEPIVAVDGAGATAEAPMDTGIKTATTTRTTMASVTMVATITTRAPMARVVAVAVAVADMVAV